MNTQQAHTIPEETPETFKPVGIFAEVDQADGTTMLAMHAGPLQPATATNHDLLTFNVLPLFTEQEKEDANMSY